jgi:hypothetical protein
VPALSRAPGVRRQFVEDESSPHGTGKSSGIIEIITVSSSSASNSSMMPPHLKLLPFIINAIVQPSDVLFLQSKMLILDNEQRLANSACISVHP